MKQPATLNRCGAEDSSEQGVELCLQGITAPSSVQADMASPRK